MIAFSSGLRFPLGHLYILGKNVQFKEKISLWTQSFTSLKADIRQDINGDLANASMEHFLEGSAPLRLS